MTTRPLLKILEQEDATLFHRAHELIRKAELLLARTVATFSSGTDHSPQHTNAVETIASMLLPPDFQAHLRPRELFFLVLACHYHDLGMAGTEGDNETAAGRDQVRRDHAIRIGDIITERWQAFGFETEKEADVLAQVCRGHRPQKDASGRANWTGLPINVVVSPTVAVRVRLLSALIYAADELHIGDDRASLFVEQQAAIMNKESQKHWRRHQKVCGPAPVDDALHYDVVIDTARMEDELRRHHLHKALTALADARTIASEAGISLRSVSIAWKRDKLWQLLIVRLLADMAPRSAETILDEVHAAFMSQSMSFPSLDGLCAEVDSSAEQQRQGIRQQLSALVTRAFCTPLPACQDAIVLSMTSNAFECFRRLLADADALDDLFGGAMAANHAFGVSRNEYGRKFAESVLIPRLKARYGVFLPNVPHDPPVLDGLRVSPTARHLADQGAPTANSLEKREVLSAIAVAGVLLDAMREPSLLLDPETRPKLRQLVHYVAEALPKYFRFLEELAVVSGLSPDEVASCVVPSEETQQILRELTQDVNEPLRVKVTQKLGTGTPFSTNSMGYLLLASRRAGTTLRLVDSAISPVAASFEGPKAQHLPQDYDLGMMEVNLGDGVIPTDVDAPCEIALEMAPARVTVRCFSFADPAAAQCPFMFRMRMRQTLVPRMRESTVCDFDVRQNHLRVQDVLLVRRIAEVIRTTQTQAVVENARTKQITAHSVFPAGSDWNLDFGVDDRVIDALAELDPTLPLPTLFETSAARKLVEAPREERAALLEQLRRVPLSERGTITSCVLRRTSDRGEIWQERLLFLCEGEGFPTPQFTIDPNGSKTSPEELARMWNDPAGTVSFETPLPGDPEQVEGTLLKWAANRSVPFPISVNRDSKIPFEVKSVFSLVRLPHIERVWYREIPVAIVVRTPTRLEVLEVEHAYWCARGDDRRAALIAERIEECLARLGSTQQTNV